MAKVGRLLGKISSIASVVLSFVPGMQPLAAAFAVNAALMGALFPPKKPPILGNPTQITIGVNQAMPYAMGRTFVGGAQIHDVAYGATDHGVPNPWRSFVFIGSQGGPIESLDSFQADFATLSIPASGGIISGEASGYYNNRIWVDSQLGATPEASHLTTGDPIDQWGSSYKLSGYAAWMVTLGDDKEGKTFSSGIPGFGMIGKWAKSYDARLDSSYPGGSGSHDFDDESTFTFSENPSVNATTYARGRYQNDLKVIGCGFRQDQIDWPAWVAFANVCDANDWKVGGTIYEGPDLSRWDNLKRICAAGGAEPCFVGGLLSVRYSAPKVALDTITRDDLADGEYVVPGMKSWRDRKNGIIPRYRSEDHKWEYVQSTLVSVEDYVTEDGEEKNEERQYDLVQDKDQAAQLAAYELVDARELGPIVLVCKPRLMEYRLGEALEIDISELGLSEKLCVIRGRSIDFSTPAPTVTLTLETETTAKHAYALGQTGTAPPTPTLSTGEEMDDAAFGVVFDTPDADDWEAEGTSLSSAGGAIPAIVVTETDVSTLDRAGLLGIQFDYRVSGGAFTMEGGAGSGWLLLEDGSRLLLEDQAPGEWIGAMLDGPDTDTKEIVSVTPGTRYDVSVQYLNRAGLSDRLIMGPVEVGVLIPAESVTVGGTWDAASIQSIKDRIDAFGIP